MAHTFEIGGQVRLIWWRLLVQPFKATTYAEMSKHKRIKRKLRLTDTEEEELEKARPDVPKDQREWTKEHRAADKAYNEWVDTQFAKQITSLDDDYVGWLKEQLDARLAENKDGNGIGYPMGDHFVDAADKIYELLGQKPEEPKD